MDDQQPSSPARRPATTVKDVQIGWYSAFELVFKVTVAAAVIWGVSALIIYLFLRRM